MLVEFLLFIVSHRAWGALRNNGVKQKWLSPKAIKGAPCPMLCLCLWGSSQVWSINSDWTLHLHTSPGVCLHVAPHGTLLPAATGNERWAICRHNKCDVTDACRNICNFLFVFGLGPQPALLCIQDLFLGGQVIAQC